MKFSTKCCALLACAFLTAIASFAQKPQLKWGGTVRFNYQLNNDNYKKVGDFNYDMFALRADGSYGKAYMAAEYRLYQKSSGGGMLRYGYLGYRWDENHDLQVGQTRVNFGCQPAQSNSYYFNQNYYLGLEDDYDLGIKYTYRHRGWTLAAGFFKDADLNNGTERYSFDAAGDFKEQNTLNFSCNYSRGETAKHEFGFSGMYGNIAHRSAKEWHSGQRNAWAAHYRFKYKDFGWTAQYTGFFYNMKENGERLESFTTGAYNATYQMVTAGNVFSGTASYDFHFGKNGKETVRLYDDFSYLKKHYGWEDAVQNIAGVMINYGPIYTYIEYIVAKNHPFFGGAKRGGGADSFGVGRNKWSNTLNINVGYYF